ncbi:LNS2-domain-containing protein, partial [Aureobasidium melanogenum]
RAINLSKKLWSSNIPSQVTDKGDIMLDMTGYKSSEDEGLRAEVLARKILSEELEGNYDIGSLIGADEKGNLWIYSSEEAKEQANRKVTQGLNVLNPAGFTSTDALSDPGYHSDDSRSETSATFNGSHIRRDSDSALGLSSGPASPQAVGDPNRNYAKTLRLSSDQLKSLDLKPGPNTMSFSVNRATCTAFIYRWRWDVPIVISDIDGTITKSDALGHVLNMIGRDWTHLGVAKLFTEISANGYNILYLTSRGVGQADTTRNYLANVVQDGGFRLPRGPTIMSPDRTIAALRREVYLRKPEVFKMACLRDIMALFTGSGGSNNADKAGPTTSAESNNGIVGRSSGKGGSPFYAGFGNRLTDALSYRSVNIPSTRIFTINSNAEVSLDLLSLNTYKTGYVSMREIVDHYFPPVGLLVKG